MTNDRYKEDQAPCEVANAQWNELQRELKKRGHDEDTIQDVVIKVLDHVNEGRVTASSIVPWGVKVAKYLRMSESRKEGNRSRLREQLGEQLGEQLLADRFGNNEFVRRNERSYVEAEEQDLEEQVRQQCKRSFAETWGVEWSELRANFFVGELGKAIGQVAAFDRAFERAAESLLREHFGTLEQARQVGGLPGEVVWILAREKGLQPKPSASCLRRAVLLLTTQDLVMYQVMGPNRRPPTVSELTCVLYLCGERVKKRRWPSEGLTVGGYLRELEGTVRKALQGAEIKLKLKEEDPESASMVWVTEQEQRLLDELDTTRAEWSFNSLDDE